MVDLMSLDPSTTAVVIAVTTISPERSNHIVAIVPIAIRIAMPTADGCNNARKAEQSTTLIRVPVRRDIPADMLWLRVSLYTKAAEITAHMTATGVLDLPVRPGRSEIMTQ
jgi:hypothetical protein